MDLLLAHRALRPTTLKRPFFAPPWIGPTMKIQALLRLLNLLYAGRDTPEVVPHLCGASLIACKKKDRWLRFIAVEDGLCHLTSKCISRGVHAEAVMVLGPVQVGVGVTVGCEANVHAVAHLQEDASICLDELWILLLDFSNAFNRVDHGSMFRNVRDHIQPTAAWRESCYDTQHFLSFGGHTIFSCCVVHQGASLAH